MKFSKQFSGYQSEFTQFLNDLKQKNPKLEEGQIAGRNLLWEQPPRDDLEELERTEASRVKQQAYVYQSK